MITFAHQSLNVDSRDMNHTMDLFADTCEEASDGEVALNVFYLIVMYIVLVVPWINTV